MKKLFNPGSNVSYQPICDGAHTKILSLNFQENNRGISVQTPGRSPVCLSGCVCVGGFCLHDNSCVLYSLCKTVSLTQGYLFFFYLFLYHLSRLRCWFLAGVRALLVPEMTPLGFHLPGLSLPYAPAICGGEREDMSSHSQHPKTHSHSQILHNDHSGLLQHELFGIDTKKTDTRL